MTLICRVVLFLVRSFNEHRFLPPPKFKQIKKIIDSKLDIIINGSYEYIKLINNKLEKIINKNTEIVDCFHIGSTDLDVLELSKKYNCILNTKKI